MREIKFRLFIGGKFSYWGFLGNGFIGLPDTNTEPLTIEEKEERSQQYTGRKDKNCKEIYEGDKWQRGDFVGIVIFKRAEWTFETAPESKCTSYPMFYNNVQWGEVVGNIYEEG